MTTSGMRWLDILRLRWRSLSRRSRIEAELDDELKFHFDSTVERYVGEGMRPDEARRRANLEFGFPAALKEECRDVRRVSFLENILRDVDYAWRGFFRQPGFTLTAVAALALGIGANSGLFSLVYSLVLRPLPVSNPETFRNIHITTRGEGPRAHYGTQYYVSWAEFNHIRSGSKAAHVSGVAEVTVSRKGDARPVRAQLVSDNLLGLIGGRPALGRFFLPQEVSSPGASPVIVLTHRAWQQRFGGASDIVGRTVVLNRTAFTIIGVADERTTGPLTLVPDIWMPLTMQALTRFGDTLIDKPNHAWIQVFARRKPGYQDAELSAEMAVLAQQSLLPHLPKRKAIVTVEPGAFFNYPFLKQQAAPILAILSLAVGLVLVVACANVANMLLARGLTRRREIAIRLSIGAGRGRLLQQLLTESILLACLGGAAGLLLAYGSGVAVLGMMPEEYIGRHQIEVSPDAIVLLFTGAVALLTGVVFGLLPALNSLRFDLSPALKSEGLGETQRRGRRRLQNALVGVQVAVCLVLLVNAGLLVRGFRNAVHADIGQTARNVLAADFDLRQQQYDAEKAERFINTLRRNVSLLPGVSAASTTFVEPLHDQCGTMASIPGSDGNAGEGFRASCDEVGPDFFRTMQISLLHGRDFTPAEMYGNSGVAIIDERFAREKFAGGIPLGRRIRIGDEESEIIGIVGTTIPLEVGAHGFAKVYRPMRGLRNVEAKLIVNYNGSAVDTERAIRDAAASLDSGVNVSIRRVEEFLDSALIPARMASAAAASLGALALMLACTGIYGVVSFAMSRRRREVGIRMALGADRTSVLRLIVWSGMKPVLVGALLGLPLAAAAAQLIRAMLYGISPFDPLAFIATALLLAAVALSAALIPAIAALRLNPALTLRHD